MYRNLEKKNEGNAATMQMIGAATIRVSADFSGSTGPHRKHCSQQTRIYKRSPYKSQSKTFSLILVDIPGPLNKTPSSRASPAYPSLESVYVKISRATTWAGLEVNQLMSKESFLAC